MKKRNNKNPYATPASAEVAYAGVKRLIRALLVLACAGCILYITIFSRALSLDRVVIAAPFSSWRAWLSGNRQTGREIVENIALFVPLGYLTASLLALFPLPAKRRAALTLLTGLVLSLGIEALQYYSGRGTLEFDDLLHNCLGTALGLLGFHAAAVLGEERAGRFLRFGVLPGLLLLACLVGSLRMRELVVMTNLITDQFWFSVDQVEEDGFGGRCRIYGRPTPDYRLFLVRGADRKEAELARDGEDYTAKIEPPDGKYEICVKFRGYRTLPTGVYLNGTRVEYTENGQAPSGPDGQPLLPGAALKACTEDFGCYVFQSGSKLIWLISPDIAPDTELICHVYPEEQENLPELRVEYGFDNLGFLASEADTTLGPYRSFTRELPADYPAISVTVGLNTGGSVIWRSAFRP